MRKLALCASVLALAVAGCGDDDEGSSESESSAAPKEAQEIRSCLEQRGDNVGDLTNTVPDSVTDQMLVNLDAPDDKSYIVYVFPDAEAAEEELGAVEEGRVNKAAEVEVVNNSTVIYRNDEALEEARECLE